MPQHLPPLEAIRYFTVAAKYNSFTLAGKELHISQSAISQKVIQLEGELGFKLFYRKPGGLVLTVEGEKLYKFTRTSFSELEELVGDLQNQALNRALCIRLLPSMASKWLLPRLPDFHSKYPEIELKIDVDLQTPNYNITDSDFKAHNIDVAFSFVKIESDDIEQKILFCDAIYPVCNPALLEGRSINSPDEIKNIPLLHDSQPELIYGYSWSDWLAYCGYPLMDTSYGHSFNRFDLIIQAAISGQGIALARHSLVATDIEEGRLIRLFDRKMDCFWWLLNLKSNSKKPWVRKFKSWVQTQAKNFSKVKF